MMNPSVAAKASPAINPDRTASEIVSMSQYSSTYAPANSTTSSQFELAAYLIDSPV
jgi:hypothetical protein